MPNKHRGRVYTLLLVMFTSGGDPTDSSPNTGLCCCFFRQRFSGARRPSRRAPRKSVAEERGFLLCENLLQLGYNTLAR